MNTLVVVAEIVSSRYEGSTAIPNKHVERISNGPVLPVSFARPASWDERKSGLDTVKDNQGNIFTLASNGQQSTPEVGWKILLREQRSDSAWTWTLYGMKS